MCVFLLLFQSYRSVRSGSLRTLHQKHIYNQPNYTQNCRAQFNSTHRSVFTMSSDFTHTPATQLMKQMYRKICTQTHIHTFDILCVHQVSNELLKFFLSTWYTTARIFELYSHISTLFRLFSAPSYVYIYQYTHRMRQTCDRQNQNENCMKIVRGLPSET